MKVVESIMKILVLGAKVRQIWDGSVRQNMDTCAQIYVSRGSYGVVVMASSAVILASAMTPSPTHCPPGSIPTLDGKMEYRGPCHNGVPLMRHDRAGSRAGVKTSK